MSGRDLRHKSIVGAATKILLQSVNGWEVLRLSIARQIHTARAIDRDAISLVVV